MPHATVYSTVLRPMEPYLLTRVPLEIVQQIGQNLDNCRDRLHLVQTCSALNNFQILEKDRYIYGDSHRSGRPSHAGQVLTWAATNNSLSTAAKALRYGLSADTSAHWDRETPLMLACRQGSFPMIKLLVDADANINSQDSRDGSSPVMMCAQRGNLEAVKYMMARGGDLQKRTRCAETALHLAAGNDHLDVVEYILQHGPPGAAGVNAMDISSCTPLHRAVRGRNPDVVRALINAGANTNAIDDDGFTVLYKSLSGLNHEMVEAVLQGGANPNAPDNLGRTPLSWAAQNGLMKRMTHLLKYGADPDAKDIWGLTPMMYAAAFGEYRVLGELTRAGADPTIRDPSGKTAYHTAVHYGQSVCARLLLVQTSMYVDLVNYQGQPALFRAAQVDDTETMKVLFTHGANANSRAYGVNSDAPGYAMTPLMTACQHGSINAVKLLLKRGADVHAMDHKGTNVLCHAAKGLAAYCIKRDLPHDHYVDGAISQLGPWKGDRYLLHAHFDRHHGLVECQLDDEATVRHIEAINLYDDDDPDAKPQLPRSWNRELNDPQVPVDKWTALFTLLLELGAGIFRGDGFGDTALSVTLQIRRSCWVEALLRMILDRAGWRREGTCLNGCVE